MIFTKMKEWFKSFKKAPLWVCSLLTIAFVGGVATACRDKGGDNSSNINSEQTVTTYTVTFETNGGNSIAPITVEEGSVLSKPTDPQKAGSKFVGWYTDSTFKTPFYFDAASAKITQDVTLYARWEVAAEVAEYVIDFNTNVEGLTYDSVETVNNKVFAGMLPVPVRVGYTFAGWAISMYDDAAKVSYMFQDGMTIAEHTTFHALWNDDASAKLATPVVNVTANGVNWKAVSGVSAYHVTISGPEGFTSVSQNTGSTTFAVDFANAPVGDYVIGVTAVASDATKNSEVAQRTYLNKALARVSFFEVEDTTLSFTAVENATDYLLTINCGDANHKHDEMSLGGATEYNFASCITTSGKVTFVVTSVAEGYASVQSRPYYYVKALDAVTGFAVNEETGIVSWDAVENAEKYVVTVDCGNDAHEHTNVVVGATQYDLKECEAQEGGIVVSVYAVAAEFGNSEAAEYNYAKTTLATPGNVTISGTTMSWDAVARATGYKVKIGNETIDVTTNSIDLSAQQIAWVEANDYVINLQAVNADGASLWSNNIDARYYAMYTSISYAEGIVSWNHVIGATEYKVKVNDGEEVTISNGKNYAPVVLTKAGENTISVCYTDGENTSDWVSTTVTAYAVEFDTMGASATFATQYKAVGDPVDSFYDITFKKSGYNFYGWYTDATVGKGNGNLYEDGYFRVAADVKLYADYTAKTYTITYMYGTEGTGTATTVEVTFGEHFQMEVPQPNGESAFDGWYTAPEANGIHLTNENGVSLNPWTIAVDEVENGNVVYAYWNDFVLNFKETKIAGSSSTVYEVTQGARINTVDTVRIPQMYRNKLVKIVAPDAFKDCTKLKKIYIPNTVEQIYTTGASAFAGCTLLEEINITEVEGNKLIRYWSQDGVLFDNGKLDEQDGTVKVAAFPMGYKSTSYRVPEGVTCVPTEAFEKSLLEEVTFSSDMTLIETRAFYSSAALTKLTFEDPVNSEDAKPLTIESRAFESCSAVQIINLPARTASLNLKKYAVTDDDVVTSGPAYENVITSNGAKSIEDSFYGCTKLQEINIAEGCTKYSSENGVVFNANKTEILYVPRYFEPENGVYVIPQGVNKIANGAFVYSTKIKELTIPSTVTNIGEYAFYYAYGIQKLTFGGNGFEDVIINKYAFRNSYNIKEIVFEKNSRVTELHEGAFMYNYQMEELTLPATIKTISDMAFRDWYYLKNVSFEEAKTDSATLAFGDAVFYNTKIEKLSIPAHVNELGIGIFNGMNKLKAIEVDPDNQSYTTVSGILYNYAKTEMLYFPKEIESGSFTLPDTLQVIGAAVFKNNDKLKSFEVPNTVTTIGENAFEDAKLTSLTFAPGNDDVALTIGANAFKNLDQVTSLTLPKRTASIGAYALSSMDALKSLTLNEGLQEIPEYGIYMDPSLESIAIPDSVTNIGYYGVGSNQKLEAITFGKNSTLEEIGEWGFANNKALKSIEIPASVKYLRYYSLYQNSSTNRGALSEVTFAEGSQLEVIGAYSFYYVGIKSITIPKSVTTIEPYAFYYSDLQELKFEMGGTEPLTIGEVATYKTSSSGSTTTSHGYVFAYTDVEEVVLPARATTLAYYSFYMVSTLKSVSFEEGKDSQLQYIGEYAFRGCKALESIFLPKSLTNLSGYKVSSTTYHRNAIGKLAFWECESLKNVVFEEGGTRPMTIGEGAFYACTGIEEVNLPSRLVTYTNSVNNSTVAPLGPVVNVNNASMMFGGCTSLKAVNIVMNSDGTPYIPENELVSIDGVVFSADKKNLVHLPVGREEAFVIPNTTEEIGSYAIARAKKITEITFEEGNDETPLEIRDSAFMQCTGLTSIKLAKRVTVIDPKAFQSCVNLESIDLSTKLTSFDATSFDGCEKLAAVNAAPDSTKFSSYNGVVFNAGTTEADFHTLYYYPVSKADQLYTVPTSVKTIYRYAFYNNTQLKEIVLPEGLQSIDDCAFYNATALETVCIPKNVATIGDEAFYNCSSLSALTFEEGGSTPLVIGNPSYLGDSVWPTSATGTVYTYLGNTFAHCSALTNVTLPERTQIITDNAFAFCYGLKSINIPANVEQMGKGVFYHCERLENVSVAPDTKLTTISYRMFEACYSLKSFVLPASVTSFEIDSKNKQSNAFAFCMSMESFEFADGCEIAVLPRGVFAGCSSLKSIVIPASVTTISSGGSGYTNYSTFYGCSSLEKVTFAEGNNFDTLGSYAFYNCRSLKEINLTETNVTSLGGYSFYNCELFETFEIPETVEEIGSYVFYGWTSLTDITIPKNLYLDDSAGLFATCTSLKEIKLPEMSVIPSYFFNGCSSLTEFEIPESVSEVYEYAFSGTGITSVTMRAGVYYEYGAFYNMDELVDLTIEDGVEEIYDEMFSDCDKLETVVFPNSVTYISYNVFYNCDNLRSVTFPQNDDFTYIEEYIFDTCPMLETVIIPENVTEIRGGLFNNAGIKTVNLPSNLTFIGYDAFYMSSLEEITIPRNVTEIEEGNTFGYCDSLKTVIFEEGSILDKINGGMFVQCSALETIVLPDSLMTIESSAFSGCTSLKSISIPETCTNIDFNAFYGCRALEEITFEGSNPAYIVKDGAVMNAGGTEIYLILPQTTGSYTIPENVVIRDGAFMNTNLDEIVIPASMTTIPKYWLSGISADTTIVIPEGVETIGEAAFAYADITSIRIPASVTSIGKNAFFNCINLKTVTIEGGDKRLYIGNSAFEGCSALESITIPSRVRLADNAASGTYAVGAYSFRNCTSLKTITFEETPAEGGVEGVINFGAQVFEGCTSLETVKFPAALGDHPTQSSTYAMQTKLFFGCTSLTSVTFSPVEGRSISMSTQVFDGCISLKNIELPTTLIYFGAKLFANSGIESIVIPESVTKFGTAYGNYINELGLSTSNSYLGRYFDGCTALKSVTWKASAEEMPACAFDGLTSLETVTFETESLKTIKFNAFDGCTGVKNITLPTSITTIEVNAFRGWQADQTINTNQTEAKTLAWSAIWTLTTEANIVYL